MSQSGLAREAMNEWLRMLDVVEASIHSAFEKSALYEAPDHDSADDDFSAIHSSKMEMIERRLTDLQAKVAAAGRIAETVEALLSDDERHSREWLELAEQTRHRLSELPASRVS